MAQRNNDIGVSELFWTEKSRALWECIKHCSCKIMWGTVMVTLKRRQQLEGLGG